MNKCELKFLIRKLVGEPYVGKRMKLGYLQELLPTLPLKGVQSILEVGCSDGLFTDWIAGKFPQSEVTSLDLDSESINELRQWAQSARKSHINFVQGDVVEMQEVAKYDLVLALDVLEHISEDRAALRAIYRAMKPGGWIIVHVPNSTYETLEGVVHQVADSEAWTFHSQHVRQGYFPEVLEERLKEAGFEQIKCWTAQGPMSDLAHRIYDRFEHPAPMRVLSLPFVDICSIVDRRFRRKFGNTVFGVARK